MNKMLTFLLTILIFPNISQAAPSVTNLSGVVSGGSQITISGSGFGANGPNIVMFDDFEKGTAGSPIATTANSAAIGQWWEVEETDGSRYSNSFAHSGVLSSMQLWDETVRDEVTFQMRADFQTRVTEGGSVYFSYWIFVPATGHVPGGPNMPNWKLWVVYGRPFAGAQSSPFTQTVLYEVLPTNYFLCPDPWYDDAGRTGLVADSHYGIYDRGYCPFGMVKGDWHRMEVYLRAGSQANGAIGTWELNAGVPRRQLGYQEGLTTIHSGDYWDTMGMPAYGRGGQFSDPLTKTYYDDVYIAIGTGSRARVEIGNASTYSGSTNMTMVTPSAWSPSAITATVRQGSFTAGQTAYLYVTDQNGEVNTVGYQVAIGSSHPPSGSLHSPSGLRIP